MMTPGQHHICSGWRLATSILWCADDDQKHRARASGWRRAGASYSWPVSLAGPRRGSAPAPARSTCLSGTLTPAEPTHKQGLGTLQTVDFIERTNSRGESKSPEFNSLLVGLILPLFSFSYLPVFLGVLYPASGMPIGNNEKEKAEEKQQGQNVITKVQ